MLSENLRKSLIHSLEAARGSISLGIKILEKLPAQPNKEKMKQELKNLIIEIGAANRGLRQGLHLIEISVLPHLKGVNPTLLERVKFWLWKRKQSKKNK